MNLHRVQTEFCDRLRDEAIPDATLFGADAPIRLGIYRNAYRARLMECLRTAFDKTWSWIGDDAFAAAARHHILAKPPSGWTLDDYGADFPATLDALFPGDPEVGEIAWLERAMQRAFAARDETPLTTTLVGQCLVCHGDAQAMRMDFVTSLELRQLHTNSVAIWSAIDRGEAPAIVGEVPDPGFLRVWRQGLSVHHAAIEEDEFLALAVLREGGDFGAACAMLALDRGEARTAARAGELLGGWLQDGLVAALA